MTTKTRLGLPAKPITLALILVLAGTGCSSFMHGYTKRQALDRYLLVDQAADNLGARRLRYIQGFRPPMRGFVENHGLPDFIYEFKEKGREGVTLFYVRRDVAYVFVEHDWRPDSIYLRDERALTDYEKMTFEELRRKDQRPSPPPEPAPSGRTSEAAPPQVPAPDTGHP
jgi:hypothetical protein